MNLQELYLLLMCSKELAGHPNLSALQGECLRRLNEMNARQVTMPKVGEATFAKVPPEVLKPVQREPVKVEAESNVPEKVERKI